MTMLIITYWQVHTYLSCYFLFPVHYHRYLITNIKECYNVHTYNTMRTKQIGSRPLFFTCLFPIFYVICQSFVKTLIHYFLDSIKYENFKTTSIRFWSHSLVHECKLCLYLDKNNYWVHSYWALVEVWKVMTLLAWATKCWLVEYILCTRRPVPSTDQALPSCFYFRISWILMKQPWKHFFGSCGFLQGLRS